LPRTTTSHRSNTPTRSSRPAHLIPGIINLPHPRNHKSSTSPSDSVSPRHPSSPSVSATQRSSRKSRSRNANENHSANSTKNAPASPLKFATSEAVLVTAADSSTPSTSPPIFQTSPSKGRRSKNRASRQTSPPLVDMTTSPQLLTPAIPTSTSDKPAFEYDPSVSLLSRSAPSTTADVSLHQHHNHRHQQPPEYQSSSDEWDMPKADPRTRTTGNLTWQQQGLSRSTGGDARNRIVARSESRSRVASGNSSGREDRRDANAGGGGKARPHLNGSVSDSSSSLTWQQELLQQSDSAPRYAPSSSPTKSQLNSHQHSQGGSGNVTPTKLRRQRQKDEETFGIGGLDLTGGDHVYDDLFSPSTPPHSQNRHQQQYANSAPRPRPAATMSTPTKVEARYAGPTFHNSPLPSSLPVPSFLLRRKAMEVVQV
jgi:hypothetical protein